MVLQCNTQIYQIVKKSIVCAFYRKYYPTQSDEMSRTEREPHFSLSSSGAKTVLNLPGIKVMVTDHTR